MKFKFSGRKTMQMHTQFDTYERRVARLLDSPQSRLESVKPAHTAAWYGISNLTCYTILLSRGKRLNILV